MRTIHILHVGLDTHLGGIETYLYKITSNIDRNHFKFSFLAYDNEKPCFFDELSALGCKFNYVRSRRRSWFGNKKDVRQLLKKEKFDIIHCHLNSLTYITPALEGLNAGAKVIVHSRNAGSAIDSSSRLLSAINKYRMPWKKVTCAAVSDLASKWMFGNNTPFIILNNGIDTKKYQFSGIDRKQIREELGISEDKEVICNVGAFRTQKNHLFLIDVFKEYHSKHTDSLLILIGEGELKERIEDRIRDNNLKDAVLLLGKRTDVSALLSASDKFLFPSLYEGFPNALIEAETNGLLCISSSSITEQACFDNCLRVSLDSPISEWVSALETDVKGNRLVYAEKVEDAGFGIHEEMSRLEKLYTSLTNGDS